MLLSEQSLSFTSCPGNQYFSCAIAHPHRSVLICLSKCATLIVRLDDQQRVIIKACWNRQADLKHGKCGLVQKSRFNKTERFRGTDSFCEETDVLAVKIQETTVLLNASGNLNSTSFQSSTRNGNSTKCSCCFLFPRKEYGLSFL